MNNDGSYITSEKSGLQNTQLYKQEYYIILKEFCEHDIDGQREMLKDKSERILNAFIEAFFVMESDKTLIG